MLDRYPADDHPPQKLLDRVRNAARTRHLSRRTENTYVGWIRRFILFHAKKHPREMGEAEINQFLTYLAVERVVGASTQNQALNLGRLGLAGSSLSQRR